MNDTRLLEQAHLGSIAKEKNCIGRIESGRGGGVSCVEFSGL